MAGTCLLGLIFQVLQAKLIVTVEASPRVTELKYPPHLGPWHVLVLMIGRHYTLHPGTQARACKILTLLHTQYAQIHHPLFSLITALTHLFINSQIMVIKLPLPPHPQLLNILYSRAREIFLEC